MPKIVKSIKGELVDFDLLKIKQEIESAPTPIEVATRKTFIDNKLQRKIRRAKDDIKQAKDLALSNEKDVEKESQINPKIRPIKKAND